MSLPGPEIPASTAIARSGLSGPRFELLAALLIALSLFAFLGSRGLNEPDEGRYAELGREMVVSGDWLVPHLNGFEHFQKPPLLYWATATSLSTFGFNEWAARLPSTLAALGVLALTAWIAATLFGRAAALTAALVLGSCIEFFALARILTPDMFLTWWITAAIACLVQVYRGKGPLWGWLFFTAMGLGFMTKGPMAMIVPISAALGMRVVQRARLRQSSATGNPQPPPRNPRNLPWVGGLLLTLAIGLSWFVILSVKHHQLFEYFAGDELLKRFASKAHGRSKPVWFFIPTLLIGFLPWTVFFPRLGLAVWRRLRSPHTTLLPIEGLLLGWVIPPFIILSLSGSKLVTYILPLLPALALALTAWWQKRAPLSRQPLLIGAGMLIILVGVASQLERFEHRFAQQASVRPLAELLRTRPDLFSATVFACNVRAHGWEFYLQSLSSVTLKQADLVLPPSPAQQARLFDSVAACERAMAARPVAYGLVRTADFAKYFAKERWQTLGQSGDFLLVGRRPQ